MNLEEFGERFHFVLNAGEDERGVEAKAEIVNAPARDRDEAHPDRIEFIGCGRRYKELEWIWGCVSGSQSAIRGAMNYASIIAHRASASPREP